MGLSVGFVFAIEETLSQVVELLEVSFTVPRSTIKDLLRARNGAWSRDEFRRNFTSDFISLEPIRQLLYFGTNSNVNQRDDYCKQTQG